MVNGNLSKVIYLGAIIFVLTGCAIPVKQEAPEVKEEVTVNVKNAIVIDPGNESLLTAIQRKGFSASISAQGVVVNIPGLFFEFGSSELVFKAREKIRSLASLVQSGFVATRKLAVVGHTDSVGDQNFNMSLSRTRAERVMDELIFSGIRPDRINLSWFGETQPIASNKNSSGRARNRRVEFIVLNN